MPNRFMPIQGDDPKAMAAQVNKNFAALDNESVTKVFSGPNGTNALIQGRLPNDLGYGQLFYDPDGLAKIYMAINADGDPIFKIAKEGYDATTTDDANLIFNSAQNVFKIVKTMDIPVAAVSQSGAGANFAAGVQAHGLGFTPIAIGFVTSNLSERTIMPWVAHTYSGGIVIKSQDVYVDPTNVTVLSSISNASAGNQSLAAFTAKVYLLQETAN